MGRDKAFLQLGNETLVARQTRLLRELGITDLLLSGRPGVDYGVPDTRIVTDSVADAGPLAGLAGVLATARHAWVLVVAVDLPRLTPEYLEKLIRAGAGRHGAVPLGDHGFEPLVALYPTTLLTHIERALREKRLGLQPLIQTAVNEGLMVALPITADERPLFTNWNTPDDTRS